MKKNLLFFITFFSTFTVYLSTLATSFVAAGDASEFVMAILTNGIAHPPGYPLFVLLGKVVILFPIANKIMLINAQSAVFGGLTCAFVALTMYWLTKSFFPSYISGILLGYSFLFWKYSVVSEVFTLNTFFAIFLLYLALTITSRRGYFLFSFILGLSLSNHQTIILIFPAFFFLLWKRKIFSSSKDNFFGFFLFLTGLLPYLYLWIAGKQYPLQNWGDTTTLYGIFNVFIRKVYGSTQLLGNDVPSSDALQQIIDYIKSTISQFTIPGIFMFLYGFFSLFRMNKIIWILLSSSFFLSGILFILYAKAPLEDFLYRAVSERFLLLPNIFCVLVIGIGVYILSMKIQKGTNHKPYRFGSYIILFLLPIYLLVTNFKTVDQKGNNFAKNTANDIFVTTPKNALLLVDDDVYYSSILYAYLVEKKRQDIAVVFPELFFPESSSAWYIALLHRHFPDVSIPALTNKNQNEYIPLFIKENLKKRQVVCACGYNLDAFHVKIPHKSVGLTDVYFLKVPEKTDLIALETEIDKAAADLKNFHPLPVYPQWYSENTVLRNYSRPYITLAFAYLHRKKYDDAERLFKKSIKISPQNCSLYGPLAGVYLKKSQTNKEKGSLRQYIACNPYDPKNTEAQQLLDELTQ